ncbi:hypothetical protein WBJ53_09180 [Spirosoma sp. SC4-14]|uniref:hypothetical protein n=1 Tax=Spirosoma sp. SC4-14 TaxID=3128900 RepID=UPI0030D2151B
MATKSLKQVLNQLTSKDGSESEGFSELSPEEAEELAGGLTDIGVNGACGNKGCPTTNSSCGKS